MNQYMLKICLKSDKIILELLRILLSFLQNVDRIYYNIYKKEYRSSIRYETITEMQYYSKAEALKVLKKRLEGQYPFFLDIYGIGEKKEAFTLARTGEFTFLYMILCEDNFEDRKEALFFILEELIATDTMIMGSCSDIADLKMKNNTGRLLSNWQLQRRKLYAKYNVLNYDLTNERNLINSDTIWYSAGWMNWYNLNYLTEKDKWLLNRCKDIFLKKTIGLHGMLFQVYRGSKDYQIKVCEERCKNFSKWLQNNRFFNRLKII